MLQSQSYCPSGPIMATTQGHLGQVPQQVPLWAPYARRPAQKHKQRGLTTLALIFYLWQAAWRISWTEKPGRLKSMVLHRVKHN